MKDIRFIKRTQSVIGADWKYALNPNGKMPWLQRVLFWALEKLGCYSPSPIQGYSEEPVRGDDLRHFIMEQRNDLMSHCGQEAACLLVGPKQITGLREQVSVYLSGEFVSRDPGFMGLRIICVPWMDGAIVLPSFKEWSEISL